MSVQLARKQELMTRISWGEDVSVFVRRNIATNSGDPELCSMRNFVCVLVFLFLFEVRVCVCTYKHMHMFIYNATSLIFHFYVLAPWRGGGTWMSKTQCTMAIAFGLRSQVTKNGGTKVLPKLSGGLFVCHPWTNASSEGPSRELEGHWSIQASPEGGETEGR